MHIGAMNHPARDPVAEVRWMAEMGLQFVDLTLEPPAAATWQTEPRALARAIREAGLGVVGHTAYYLPIGHPFETVRQAAVSAGKTMTSASGSGAPAASDTVPERRVIFCANLSTRPVTSRSRSSSGCGTRSTGASAAAACPCARARSTTPRTSSPRRGAGRGSSPWTEVGPGALSRGAPGRAAA